MNAYKVSVVNEYIARLISTDPILSSISVVGEISNLKYHYTGHVYFTLSDEYSSLKCIIFKSVSDRIDISLEEGMEVILTGNLNVYKKGGSYSLNVMDVELKNDKGKLALEFEKTKDKLEKEGLFSSEHKRKLPKFPKKIGVITALNGAAIEDIKKVILSKNKVCDILIFPSKVQGILAANDMIETLSYVNNNFKDLDLIILGRGGGSQEDLSAFNDEDLARAIYNSEIPIISAVGHEIDISISDFVADATAPTPTKAAEIAVPDTNEIENNIDELKKYLLIDLKNKLIYKEAVLNNILKDIRFNLESRIDQYKSTLDKLKLSLEYNNPNKILNKGYSILKDNNEIINSVYELKSGNPYEIILRDGKATFLIENLKVGD